MGSGVCQPGYSPCWQLVRHITSGQFLGHPTQMWLPFFQGCSSRCDLFPEVHVCWSTFCCYDKMPKARHCLKNVYLAFGDWKSKMGRVLFVSPKGSDIMAMTRRGHRVEERLNFAVALLYNQLLREVTYPGRLARLLSKGRLLQWLSDLALRLTSSNHQASSTGMLWGQTTSRLWHVLVWFPPILERVTCIASKILWICWNTTLECRCILWLLLHSL